MSRNNDDIRPWVSIGEAAIQVLGKMASAMEEKLEGEQLFLARISTLADHDTDSGQTTMDTEDLRRLVEIAERYRKMDREAAKYIETAIVTHSRHFTGDDPYVGWAGLGRALREDYELLDAFEQAEQEEVDAILKDGVTATVTIGGFKPFEDD